MLRLLVVCMKAKKKIVLPFGRERLVNFVAVILCVDVVFGIVIFLLPVEMNE